MPEINDMPLSEGATPSFGQNEAKSEAPVSKPKTFQSLMNMPDSELAKMAPKPAMGKDAPRKAEKQVEEDEDSDDDLDDEESDGEDLTSPEDDEGEEDSEDEAEEVDEESSDEEEEESTDKNKEVLFKNVLINGERRNITREQALSMIASGAHTFESRKKWESEQAEKEKQLGDHAAQIQYMDQVITPIYEKIQKQDIIGAILDLAQQTGKSRLDVKRKLYQDIEADIVQRVILREKNPAAYEALMLKEQNEFLSSENERLTKKPQNTEGDEMRKAQQYIYDLQREHGISTAEFIKHRDWVKQNMPDKELTPELVVQATLQWRAINKGMAAIRLKAKGLASNEKFVDEVIKKAEQNPQMDMVDLASFVKKTAKRYSQESVAKEVTKEDELKRSISSKILKTKDKKGIQRTPSSENKPKSFRDIRQLRDDPTGFELP